jgi:hypothetical protein
MQGIECRSTQAHNANTVALHTACPALITHVYQSAASRPASHILSDFIARALHLQPFEMASPAKAFPACACCRLCTVSGFASQKFGANCKSFSL